MTVQDPFERSLAHNRARRPEWYVDPAAPGAPAAAVDFYLSVLGLPGSKVVYLSSAPPGYREFCFSPTGRCATPLDDVLALFMGSVADGLRDGARAFVQVEHPEDRSALRSDTLYYAALGNGAWFPVRPEQVQIECPRQDPSSGRAWPRVRAPLRTVRARQERLPHSLAGALRYAARATRSGPVRPFYRGLRAEREWILKASAGWGRYSRRLGAPIGRVRGRLMARAVKGVPGAVLQRFDDLASGVRSPLTGEEAKVRAALAGVMETSAANADVGETAFVRALDGYLASVRKGRPA